MQTVTYDYPGFSIINIAFKVNRKLAFDGQTDTFRDDAEANTHLGREYRRLWMLPMV